MNGSRQRRAPDPAAILHPELSCALDRMGLEARPVGTDAGQEREIARLREEIRGWHIAWNGASERWQHAEQECSRLAAAAMGDTLARFEDNGG